MRNLKPNKLRCLSPFSSGHPTPDFAALAKRISVWTTRGLLSALVLAAGLGLGRQIIHWWAAPNATAGLSSAQPIADPEADCSISFGQSPWAVSRRTIAGDRRQAVEGLRAFCRERLLSIVGGDSSRRSKDDPTVNRRQETPPTNTPTPDVRDELPLLKILSETNPVDSSPGRWRLYEMSETLPMAVGLCREDKQILSKTDETAQMDLAQGGYRVVIWALAAPSAENQWTLMLFQPDADGMVSSGHSSVALPPGCRRTMAVRTADGWEIVGFRGSTAAEEIKGFFDRQASDQGAKPTGGWLSRGNAWHVKYLGNDKRVVEVRFGPDASGEFGGIVMLYPTSNPKIPNP